MIGPASPAPRLDVVLALQRTIAAVRADLAAVLAGGLLLVSLPALIARWAAPEAGFAPDIATLVTTLRAVLAMLYVALVSWGVVSRLAGHALAPPEFMRQGLARAQPGLKVALLAGAAVVLGLTIQLFARHGTTQGFLLHTALLTLGLWALCTLMPAVPVAIVERLGPVAALRRAAALTAGNRDRTLILGLIAGLALLPAGLLVGGWPGQLGPVLEALYELCAWGLAGALPAVVYAGLRAVE